MLPSRSSFATAVLARDPTIFRDPAEAKILRDLFCALIPGDSTDFLVTLAERRYFHPALWRIVRKTLRRRGVTLDVDTAPLNFSRLFRRGAQLKMLAPALS